MASKAVSIYNEQQRIHFYQYTIHFKGALLAQDQGTICKAHLDSFCEMRYKAT